MDQIVKEAHSIGEVVQHESPALAAFIQMKTDLAQARSILFSCDIAVSIDIESKIKSIDLVKILGNLVDNAFEECDTLPIEHKQVGIVLRDVPEEMIIEVSNQSHPLSEMDIQKMILPGYTTKKAGHTGLGLAIVHERVQHYRGILSINYFPVKGTVIQVKLPRYTKKTPQSPVIVDETTTFP
jgi:sensor histidine kinase regulating citrate/malate metabolism